MCVLFHNCKLLLTRAILGCFFFFTPWNNLFLLTLRELELTSNSLPNKYTIFFMIRGNLFLHTWPTLTPYLTIILLYSTEYYQSGVFQYLQSSCKLGHIGRAGLLVIVLVLHNYGSILYSNKPKSVSHVCLHMLSSTHCHLTT
jgi:hypothetical protein